MASDWLTVNLGMVIWDTRLVFLVYFECFILVFIYYMSL